LNLKCVVLVSKFAFKFNLLYRYAEEQASEALTEAEAAFKRAEVGLTYSLKTPGFNP
jgi:hypothetical protein